MSNQNSHEQLTSPVKLKSDLERIFRSKTVDKIIDLRNEVTEFMVALIQICKADK